MYAIRSYYVTYILGGRATLTVKVGFLMIAVPGFLLAAQGFAEQPRRPDARELQELRRVVGPPGQVV